MLGWLHRGAAGRCGAEHLFPWSGTHGRRLQLPCQRGKSGSVLKPGLQSQWFHLLLHPCNPEQGEQSNSAGTGTQSADAAQIFCQMIPSPAFLWVLSLLHMESKSFHNKTHTQPQPRHTPAQPEPSTTFPTKLLEGFCALWSNLGLYLSGNQPSTG